MVLVLRQAGLAWLPPPGGTAEAAWLLFSASALGAAVFAAALVGFWALAGRPKGAETDGLMLAGRTLGGVAGRFRRG
jgi:hypothetical protein